MLQNIVGEPTDTPLGVTKRRDLRPIIGKRFLDMGSEKLRDVGTKGALIV
jgi:hypothetical protein